MGLIDLLLSILSHFYQQKVVSNEELPHKSELSSRSLKMYDDKEYEIGSNSKEDIMVGRTLIVQHHHSTHQKNALFFFRCVYNW